MAVLGSHQTGSGDLNSSCGKVKMETSWQVMTVLNTLCSHISRTQGVDTGSTNPTPTFFWERIFTPRSLNYDVRYPRDCIEILRSRPFKFSARSCNKWALNRVILCGDSAHVFPPCKFSNILNSIPLPFLALMRRSAKLE